MLNFFEFEKQFKEMYISALHFDDFEPIYIFYKEFVPEFFNEIFNKGIKHNDDFFKLLVYEMILDSPDFNHSEHQLAFLKAYKLVCNQPHSEKIVADMVKSYQKKYKNNKENET